MNCSFLILTCKMIDVSSLCFTCRFSDQLCIARRVPALCKENSCWSFRSCPSCQTGIENCWNKFVKSSLLLSSRCFLRHKQQHCMKRLSQLRSNHIHGTISIDNKLDAEATITYCLARGRQQQGHVLSLQRVPSQRSI